MLERNLRNLCGRQTKQKIVIHRLKCSRVWGGGSGFTSLTLGLQRATLDTLKGGLGQVPMGKEGRIKRLGQVWDGHVHTAIF